MRSYTIWALLALLMLTCGLILLAAVEPVGYISSGSDLVPLGIPFRGNLARGTFKAGWSQPHYVGFKLQGGDPRLVDSIERLASRLVGSKVEKPNFDISWQVLQGDSVVAQGSGRDRLAGTFGSTIGIGYFRAHAGELYEVEATLGSDFAPLQRCEPLLEVGVAAAAPSVARALVQDIGRLLQRVTGWFAIFLGLFFGTLSVSAYKNGTRPA